ncbi:hypothetical protein RYZ20_04505 [Thioclava sp. A2]|uniref:hypothetical protein n=1 Tax=Thioclava sp. FCG-A2 TaxID=3080562 RepID=UPI0029547EF6|nr:hypothetical protein [Thioclava sp. A2]MDV7270160.1 hypothetical protein [Thioclava sp. A2]
MKPDFALNLSHDGIGLLQRMGDGWLVLEELSLDAPDLPEQLAAMRARAEGLAPQGLMTKLVIPASQILYTRVNASGPSPAARRKQIATALEGMTPYPVADLVFDWSGTGPEVAVAVVARETLSEAETFAQTYGFAPVAFCAIPDERDFPAEVWFGLASGAAALLPEGERILRDTQIMRILSAEDVPPPAAPEVEDALPEEAAPVEEPPVEVAPPEPQAEPRPAPEDLAPVLHEPPVEEQEPEPALDAPLTEAPSPETQPDEPPHTEEPPAPAGATPEPEGPDAAPTETPAPATEEAQPSPEPPPADAATPAPAKDTPDGEPAPVEAAPASTEQAAFDVGLSAVSAKIETPEPPAPAPRLGGVKRATDKAASPAATKQKTAAKDAISLAKATSVGLEKASKTARKLGKTAGTAGGAALQAASARLKSAQAKPEALPATPAAEPPAVTVFGAPKSRIGGKPKHLGLALVGGLAAMLVLVGVWASFLEAPTEPAAVEEQIAAATPAPQEEAPAPEAAPEAAEVIEPEVIEPEPEVAPAPEPATEPATEPAVELATPEPAPQPAPLPALPPNTLPPLSVAIAEIAPAPEPQPEPAPAIDPTPEGTLSPEGFTLFAGRPDLVPGPRPAAVLAAYSAANAPYADPALKGFRPRPRPASVTNAFEASRQAPAAVEPAAPEALPEEDHTALPYADPALAGARPKARPASVLEAARLALTPPPVANPAAARLASIRPRARPASILSAASDAQAQAAADAAAAALATRTDPFEGATRLAVTVSRRPPSKPSNIAAIAANARRIETAAAKPGRPEPTVVSAPAQDDEIDEPEPTAAAPKIPTSASVAKQATVRNGIDLGEMNLIGLFGSSKSRRALIRMPNGKFVKVGVGDRLDGGKVTAIGTDTISYTKKSRNYTLKLLKGS